MNYLNTYHKYQEELKVQEIINWIDLNINESDSADSIWNKTQDKIKSLSRSAKNKVIKYALISLLAVDSVTNVIKIVQNSNAKPEDKKIAIEMCKKQADKEEKSDDMFKAGYDFEISELGINHIKKEESCNLTPYKLGDGKITVGWGHAEDPNKSKLKVGKKISQKKADKFFEKDLKLASDGVKRIFKEWESKGLDIKITQKMFDALVSIAFNTGVSALRQSDIIQNLKRGEYEAAGDSIKKFKISDKYPGLVTRRSKESKMFLDQNI
jgi:GH24 family phage-related lysozyme (muramidase)